MDHIVAIQRWLYGSMASGLGDVAGGHPWAVFVAMAAAILFGVLHALMPGHGKMILVSYHLGKKAPLSQAVANGSIVALTHVGLALFLVLAGFAVISRAFAYGGRTPQFEMASGVLVALIGAFLLWRAMRGSHALETERSGKTLAFVTGLIPCPLTTFIMSYALARGLLGAGLAVTAAMMLGMIATIAGFALAATLARDRFLNVLVRTEAWRHRAGRILEVVGAGMVIALGLWLVWTAKV